MAPRVVFLGDDFTGASDTLAAFTRAGWSARLFLDLPGAGEAAALDAVGIASNLRGMSRADIADEIARLAPGIKALGADLVHFKVCSTFDSSPAIGSIGEALRGLEAVLDPVVTALIGGQPSLGRYCAFGTLFARASDGLVYRIDRHPVMRNHPVTPMGEADLTRHLAAQGVEPLMRLNHPELQQSDPDQLAARLRGRVLLDVMNQSDLSRIGEALHRVPGMRLLVGASCVAEALTLGAIAPAAAAPAAGPASTGVFVFAGSRSSVTEAQVAAAQGLQRICIREQDLASPGSLVARSAELLVDGVPVLMHLDPKADYALDAAGLATRCAGVVDRVLALCPVGWLGLAGGDSSSTICQTLGFTDLRFVDAMDPGVCLCQASHKSALRDGMRVMLKGGQMGRADLLTRFCALARMENPANPRIG